MVQIKIICPNHGVLGTVEDFLEKPMLCPKLIPQRGVACKSVLYMKKAKS